VGGTPNGGALDGAREEKHYVYPGEMPVALMQIGKFARFPNRGSACQA
jgi:hypothetical protein